MGIGNQEAHVVATNSTSLAELGTLNSASTTFENKLPKVRLNFGKLRQQKTLLTY